MNNNNVQYNVQKPLLPAPPISAAVSAGTEPPMDNSQTVGDLMNSFWTYFSKMQQSTPTDAEIKQFMQIVNDLQTYFTANGNPTFANNPKTWAVWNVINNFDVDGTSSLATLSKADDAASIQAIESPAAQSEINAVVWPTIQSWYGTNPTIQQSSDATFEADMKALLGDLNSYAANPSDRFAERIAEDITAITADAKGLPGGAITDGYLKSAEDFITANGLDTLAQAYETAPTSANLTALETELNSTSTDSSNKTTVSSDLQAVINAAGAEEYNNWSA